MGGPHRYSATPGNADKIKRPPPRKAVRDGAGGIQETLGRTRACARVPVRQRRTRNKENARTAGRGLLGGPCVPAPAPAPAPRSGGSGAPARLALAARWRRRPGPGPPRPAPGAGQEGRCPGAAAAAAAGGWRRRRPRPPPAAFPAGVGAHRALLQAGGERKRSGNRRGEP